MKTNLLKSTPLFNVLPAILLLLMSLLLWSCEEEHNHPEPAPHAEVPDRLQGKWQAGKFSMGEFWNRDGSFGGNAIEVGIAFDFEADGKCAFYFVTGGTSYGCRTEAFVYKKGTVAFDDDSFTFTPTEGSARGFYKGCASSYQNYNNPYKPGDLKPETYYYSLEKGANGKDRMVIRFEPDAENSTTFYPANW